MMTFGGLAPVVMQGKENAILRDHLVQGVRGGIWKFGVRKHAWALVKYVNPLLHGNPLNKTIARFAVKDPAQSTKYKP